MKIHKMLAASALALGLQGNAQADMASVEYDGVIDVCVGVCGIFSAVGDILDIDFDLTFPTGGGTVTNTGDVSNVDIVITTATGFLGFTAGGSSAVNLTVNAIGAPTAGTGTFFATGATTGINVQASIDVAAGTWEAFVIPATGPLEPLASGTGAFTAPVPVPAALWLFGSGLAGLISIARRRTA